MDGDSSSIFSNPELTFCQIQPQTDSEGTTFQNHNYIVYEFILKAIFPSECGMIGLGEKKTPEDDKKGSFFFKLLEGEHNFCEPPKHEDSLIFLISKKDKHCKLFINYQDKGILWKDDERFATKELYPCMWI